MGRYHRIAVSVFFGLATVALCVLWVRSYWVNDILGFGTQRFNFVTVISQTGGVNTIAFSEFGRNGTMLPTSFRSTPTGDTAIYPVKVNGVPLRSVCGFYFFVSPNMIAATIPYWFVTAWLGAIAALSGLGRAPWLRVRRFSVRTLLPATTLLAVTLGLGVWLAR